jgi:hypothetical protein
MLPVVPGKSFFPNLKQFPVTPGAAYTLDTSLSAPATYGASSQRLHIDQIQPATTHP